MITEKDILAMELRPIDPTNEEIAYVQANFLENNRAAIETEAAKISRVRNIIRCADILAREMGPKKIQCIQILRMASGFGLKDSKDIMDDAHCRYEEKKAADAAASQPSWLHPDERI